MMRSRRQLFEESMKQGSSLRALHLNDIEALKADSKALEVTEVMYLYVRSMPVVYFWPSIFSVKRVEDFSYISSPSACLDYPQKLVGQPQSTLTKLNCAMATWWLDDCEESLARAPPNYGSVQAKAKPEYPPSPTDSVDIEAKNRDLKDLRDQFVETFKESSERLCDSPSPQERRALVVCCYTVLLRTDKLGVLTCLELRLPSPIAESLQAYYGEPRLTPLESSKC